MKLKEDRSTKIISNNYKTWFSPTIEGVAHNVVTDKKQSPWEKKT